MSLRRNRGFLQEFADWGKDLEELKSSQPIGGQSFINYKVSSSSQNDFSVLMDSVYKDFRIEFFHDMPGEYHIVSLSHFHRVGNPDVMASPELVAFETGRFLRLVRERPFRSRNSWILTCVDFTQGSHTDFTYYVKLFFRGTAKGSFVVTPL